MKEETERLVEYLKVAVARVYEEDRPLFNYEDKERRGLEQAFVFRVGIYLHEILTTTKYKSLDLDSEYTKFNNDPKISISHPSGLRPDLLLHERGGQDNNLMAVEFKGWWNKETHNDIGKLEDLTSIKFHYQYHIGVFVKLGPKDAKYQIVIDGEIQDE